MSKTYANKPAFARAGAEHSQGGNYEQDGMTLREHYAGLAMQAFISGHIANYGHENFWPSESLASCAVEHADALIAELSKGGDA